MFLTKDRSRESQKLGKSRQARRARSSFRPMLLDRLEHRLLLTTATTLVVANDSVTYGGTTNLNAVLNFGNTPLSNESVDFHLGNIDLGTSMTNGSGSATIPSGSLAAFHVGNYVGGISASFAGDATYSASSGSANLAVTPAPLTITANNQTKIYGDALQALTASYTGFVNGDTPANFSPVGTITTSATAASHVSGSPYTITASGVGESDYSISYVAGNLLVTTAPLTITANNQTKVYGAALPTLTASYTGLVNGDTSASLTTPTTLSSSATAASHVAGSPYAVTASGAADTDYAISYVAGNLSVTTAPLTITAINQTKVYGAALPTLTAFYTGFVNGDTTANLTTPPTLSTTATAASHVVVGPYAITASGAADTDYTISYSAGSLNVTTAPLTITANNQTKVYGAALPSLTASYTGFVNADVPANLTTPPTLTTTATAASHVAGSPYAITAAAAVDTDYTISYAAGNLSVTTAPLTITANNQTKIYGAALPALTASYTGFVNGDTSASLTTPPTLSTPATAASHVSGSPYAITAAAAVDTDYAISYVAGNLSVTTAPLTITAINQAKVYGAALPTLTASYTGFVNGDVPASLSTLPTLATTATASSHVVGSPYAITASGAATTDYSISYVAGSLNVTTAPLTITADNQTKVYGAALPSLTASYTGFVNADVPTSLSTLPTLASTATAASHVSGSPYAITANGAVDTDYAISYVAGNLSVTTAPLTITANNQTKVYGAALPSLTASYTGFVNADVPASLSTSPTLASTATAASHVSGSPYAITAAAAVDTDYAITYVPGTLVVTTAPLTITADSQTKVYGAPLPTLTASYLGLVNGDSSASLSTPPTLITTATAASHVSGSPYAITANGAVDTDYSITVVPGSLTVTPAPLSIVIDNLSKVYGQANLTLTGTVTGVLTGDVVVADYATTASASSDVLNGGYPITLSDLSGLNASDYSTTVTNALVTPGTLTVTPAPLTIAAVNQTKVYGQPNPTFTATYSGFVLNQDPTVLAGILGFNTQATTASHFNIYTITPNGLTSTDYAINDVIAGIAVTPAPLVVTAPSLFKTYGQAVPTLTPTFSGFVNGDTPASLTTPVTVTTPANAASHVAFYPTIPSGGTSLDYAITNTIGILDNLPARLVATPSSGFAAFGQALPAFTVSYSGFANGDTAANLTSPATVSTSATVGSAPGFYTVIASGGTSADYTVVGNYGFLDILPPVTPTFNSGQVAFVTSLYTDMLGRTPEVSGIGYWITKLNQGVTRASVSQQIYQSAEGVTYRANHRGHTVSQAKALSNALQAQSKATPV